MKNSSLLENFLGYCDNGIVISCTGDIIINDLEMEDFEFTNNQGNFVIYNRGDNSERLVIPRLDKDWKLQEDDYTIHIHNENLDIYIDEMI